MTHATLNATPPCLQALTKVSVHSSCSSYEVAAGDGPALMVQATIEALPDAIAVLDERGRVLAANQAWRNLTRRVGLQKTGEVTGHDYASIFFRRSEMICAPASAPRKMRRLFSGKSRRIQFDYEIADRNRRYYHRLTASRHFEGGHERVVVLHHDITLAIDIAKERHMWERRLFDIQLEERERIARELHDSTAQHLAAIGLILDRLPNLSTDPATAMVARDVRNVLAEAQREIRATCFLLHPPALAEGGLHLALDRLLSGFSERTRLPVRYESSLPNIAIAAESKVALFRICQEALTNIHKHARATTATVRLHQSGRHVALEIEDDGIGIEHRPAPPHNPPLGVGVPGMRARAALLGGELTISRPAKGTLVRALVPSAPRTR